MINRCTVAGCDAPADDAFVCLGCGRELFADLVAVPWLLDHLAVTLARLDHIAGQVGAASNTGAPLPPRWSAVQAGTTLRYTLNPWAKRVAEQRGVVYDLATDDPAAVARWLGGHLVRVRQCPDGGELVDEVRYAIDQVRRAIDRPPDLWFAGPCDTCGNDLYCGADQYGNPTSSVIRCPSCRHSYDTTDRREWLLAAAHDHLATATEIAQALPSLYGRGLPVNTIRSWIARGQLLPRAWLHGGRVHTHPQSDRDRPLCRIGDVIDLARRRDERVGGR